MQLDIYTVAEKWCITSQIKNLCVYQKLTIVVIRQCNNYTVCDCTCIRNCDVRCSFSNVPPGWTCEMEWGQSETSLWNHLLHIQLLRSLCRKWTEPASLQKTLPSTLKGFQEMLVLIINHVKTELPILEAFGGQVNTGCCTLGVVKR